MLRLVSDEDVHDAIIRGLRRREPTLDIVRATKIFHEPNSAREPSPSLSQNLTRRPAADV